VKGGPVAVQRRGLSKTVLSITMTVILTIVCAGFAWIAVGIARSLEAEKTLTAVHIVANLLEQYVRANDGEWPDSWQSLESTHIEPGGGYVWPRDRQLLEKRVSIAFDVDPNQIATQTETTFTAITPIGPCYEGYERSFIPLLQAIRETQ
jgi:hypothetical protein